MYIFNKNIIIIKKRKRERCLLLVLYRLTVNNKYHDVILFYITFHMHIYEFL